MTQYEKSGPKKAVEDKDTDADLHQRVDALQRRVAQQESLIADISKEIRRLKEKLDRHADHPNRTNRG